MVDPPEREEAAREGRGDAAVDPAAEAERIHTPRTPARALAGVWLAVAAVVAIVLAIVLTVYFVYG